MEKILTFFFIALTSLSSVFEDARKRPFWSTFKVGVVLTALSTPFMIVYDKSNPWVEAESHLQAYENYYPIAVMAVKGEFSQRVYVIFPKGLYFPSAVVVSKSKDAVAESLYNPPLFIFILFLNCFGWYLVVNFFRTSVIRRKLNEA